MSEVGAVAVRTAPARTLEHPARPISEVDGSTAKARPTGVDEFDRVLGGGLVPGAVVLVAGEPGIGKSTLLLDVAARAAQDAPLRRTSREGMDQSTGPDSPGAMPKAVLYVTGEESAAQGPWPRRAHWCCR